MTYLNCPVCGLSVERRGDEVADHAHADAAHGEPCPRCQGRFGAEIPMYATERPRPPFALRRSREHQTA